MVVRPGVIETQYGFFDCAGPRFDISAVAHGLGFLCRFTGHTRVFYSVADHSILVSRITEFLGGDPLEGLLHDAHESVMNDMATPIKALLPEYRYMERNVATALRIQYGVPVEVSHHVKLADTSALAVEARAFMPSKGEEYLSGFDYKQAVALEKIGYGISEEVLAHPLDGALRFEREYERITGKKVRYAPE